MSDTRVEIDGAAMEAVLLKARHAALVDGATRLNERGQANSPVLSGNLRRSHRVNGPDAEAREAEVEATANYAAAVHEGHREFVFGNATGRYRPANPWLARSVDELAAEEMG